ncbi:MAG: response regulator [Lentisphaeria bacterium]|nr:response regulator [Lentisphaeria bacterium]
MADEKFTPEKLSGGETLLIVDDHETIWDFLIEALQSLGYQILLAENGLDAVEIFRCNPGEIDLVMLDMIMPKLGGHDAFLQLRQIDPNIKILLSSGYVSQEEVQDLIKLGRCRFIAKPHRLPEVLQNIRELLDEKI